MRIVKEQNFSSANFYNETGLATYTAPRDMVVNVRVKITTSTSGALQQKLYIDNRPVGPTKSHTFGAEGNLLLGEGADLIPLQSGEQLLVAVKSDNSGDTSEDGTVFISEVDLLGADLYTAVIERVRDDMESTPADEWTVSWFKNGVALTSGISDAELTVTKRSDGDDLFTDQPLSEIGENTGVFKYDATGSQRGPDGQTLIAPATATIDGAERSFTDIIARDRTT